MKRDLLACLVVMVLLVGCAVVPMTPPAESGLLNPGVDSTPGLGSAATLPTYTNPVYPGDFPDPFVLRVGSLYYAYATNAGEVNVQALRSEDLSHWEYLADALPVLPDWTAWHQGLTWAPAVLPRGDRFVLYYTARSREAGFQCISRAVGEHPEGPFRDDSTGPLICQREGGGAIDPSPFVDADGRAYLLWKNDGNSTTKPTGIWIQALTEDGLAVTGEAHELIRKDQFWEHPLIEGPAMVAHDGQYYLFYSGNWWESHEYAIGYALCETATGPCTKPQKRPLFAYQGRVMGPGGAEFFTDPEGNLWMAYHAWTAPDVGYPGGSRSLRLERVSFVDGRPVLNGPTENPQPLP